MTEPRPATEARRPELEEILSGLRRALSERDEAPGGDWLDQAVSDLLSGAKPGWFLPIAETGGIAFYSRRGSMAFGHLHAPAGPAGPERALALAASLRSALPPEVATLDLGFSGLPADEEAAVVTQLAQAQGSTVIRRQAMERRLGPEDAGHAPEPPRGVRRLPVREVTLEALADLDRRGFAGSVDALLVGQEPDDYRRSVSAILDDQLGRFLDEASVALLESDPVRLVGLLLTSEKSPRRGVFLDLVVDPERRGRGLGRFLLGWGLRALWGLGYERVRLWVSLENAAALALYRREGFVPLGGATIYRWDRASSSAQPQRPR